MIKKIYFAIPLILSILISINFFWIVPLVPGFDTPYYLTEIRSFAADLPGPLAYLYPDRYLTVAFPSLLSRLFGLDPVVSYRIAITTIYLLIALALQKLCRNLIKDVRTATLMAASLVISPFLILYASNLFANFTGFLIAFSFFAVETTRDFKFKNILLGVIFGLIFYIHNFTSVSFGLIAITYFLIKALFYRDLSIIKRAALVFAVAVLVGIFTLWRYIPVGIPSAHASSGTNFSTPLVTKISLPSQPNLLGDEKIRIVTAFKEHTGKFWLLFFIAFSVYSLITRSREIKKEKNRFIIPLAIFIPGLFLSFQPYFGTNWLPERFVTFVSLSTYFFYIALITLPSFKKISLYLATIPLLLNFMASDSLILNRGYRAISAEEQVVYQYINKNVKAGEGDRNKWPMVLLSTEHLYWAGYFLRYYTLVSGEYFISCGRLDKYPGYGATNYLVAKILGSNDATESAKNLKDIRSAYLGRKIYFLTDENMSCGKGKILEKLNEVKDIYTNNNWHVYEVL